MVGLQYIDLSEVFRLREGENIRTIVESFFAGWVDQVTWFSHAANGLSEQELTDLFSEYPRDFPILDIWNTLTCISHLGMIPYLYHRFNEGGYRRVTLITSYEDLLERARNAACDHTSAQNPTLSIESLEKESEELNRQWMRIKDTKFPSSQIDLKEVIRVERELTLLVRDALLEPWDTVPSKFSFGTLKQ